MLINFDRVNYHFLEAVLSVAGFKAHFLTLICLLYATPGAMVEVNVMKLNLFMVFKIHSCTRRIRSHPGLFYLVLSPRPGTLPIPTTWPCLYREMMRLTKSAEKSTGMRCLLEHRLTTISLLSYRWVRKMLPSASWTDLTRYLASGLAQTFSWRKN